MSEVNLQEVDKLEVTILVENYADLLLESDEGVKRAEIPPERRLESLLAEHGLSCLVKVFAGSEEHWILMDAGISSTCLLHNADILGVDLSRIENVVLSHEHFDHFGGLMGFLNKARKGIPIVLHSDAFLEFRFNIPDRQIVREMPRLDRTTLTETGAVLCESNEVSTLASDLILVTGKVERTTDFEKGFPWVEAKINDEWVVDPFHHDQGLAVKVKGKGLVVIGGCSHAGIINTVRHAQKVTGTDKVHAVLGGFHLSGRLFEPIIGQTIKEMKKIAPDFVVPMHCTGWKAINQFAVEMPNQFILDAVGTTYTFQ